MANYTEKEGATGKKYTVYSDRIKVTYTDGSSRIVRPTDVSYQATKDAMEQDIADKKWWKKGDSTTTAFNALGNGKTDGLVSAAGKPAVDTAIQKENAIADRTKSMANLEKQVQFNNNVAKAQTGMNAAQQQIQNPVQPMTFAEKQRQASMQNLEYMVEKNQMQNDGGAKLNPIVKSVTPQITVNNVLNNMPSQLNNQPVSNMDVAKHTLESILHGVTGSAKQAVQALMQYSFDDADAYRMARTGNPALVNALSNPQQTDALADKFAQDRIETAQQYAEKMQEINEKYNADNFNTAQQAVGQIGSAVGQIAPAMLLGPAYLLPYMYGMSANQALGEGASISQADDFAVLNTAKEFLIEMLVGGVPVGKMKSFIEPEKLMAKFNIDLGTANKVASRLFKALGEGGEEVLAGMAEPYLQRHTYNSEAENASLEELAWQFLIGAGAGGVFQGIDVANSRINNRNQRETQQIIQNMMQNAQKQQNLQAENAESLQKPQNNVGQAIVEDVIKNITAPNKAAQEQSSQADISQNVVENVLKQNQVENRSEQPTITEKSSTVGLNAELDGYSEKEISNMEGPKIKIARTMKDLSDFIDEAIKNKGNKKVKLFIGKVGRNLGERIKRDANVNVAGYNVSLSNHETVKIMLNSHGDEQKESLRGQRAVKKEDLMLMVDVVGNPDKIVYAGETEQGKPVIRFEKSLGDLYVCVQTVSDKHHTIESKTMYIIKKSHSTGTDDLKSPEATSETNSGKALFVDNSISYNQQKSNANEQTLYSDEFDINEIPAETLDFYNGIIGRFGRAKLSRNLDDDTPGLYGNGEVILNANRLGDRDVMIFAIVHEFMHKMKGTAEYNQISDLALRYFRSITNDPEVTDVDLVDYIVGTREGSSHPIKDEAEAYDELTALFSEVAFGHEGAIDYICKEQPNLARRFLEFIEQKIRDYKAKKGMTKLEKQQYDMLSKARQLYVKGLRKSNQNDSAVAESRFSVQADNRQKQFDAIQNSNPMLDDYHTGIRSAEDVLTFEEAIQENVFTPDYTEEDAQNALRKGKITVYSSYPISQGVFVTPSKMEARLYAGGEGGKVYSKTVSLNDVAWIDSLEGQYAKVENSSVQNRDSNDRQLTAEQADYFKDSKVRDDNGNLMVMYHGSPNAGFTEFRSGTYFTPMKWYADGYKKQGASMLSYKKTADNPDTYEVYLNIEKPFDTRNPKERRIFEQEYYQQWGSGAPLADSGLPDWTDGMDLQEFIEEKGYDYDGLILDEGAVGGYGEEVKSRGLSYVVFNPEQVKNVDNQTPTKSADIRYSTGGSASKRIEEIKNIKHGQKISKVYSNTMMNSQLFNEVEKTLELQEGDYAYDVKSEKESLMRAAKRLEDDYTGTVKELMHKKQYTGEDVDAAMFLLQQGIERGRETGNYSHAKAWVKKLATAGTEGGRTVQAFAKYSRTTAEGIATQAQRYVDQSEKALKKNKIVGQEVDSAKWRKVEAETEQAEKIIAEAEAQAQKSAEDKLSEMLAVKAESMVKGSSRKQELTDKQIVNELYNVLTETGIPDNRTKKKTDVYEYLRHAVNNKDRYTDVWEKAQQLLKEKYPADTEFDTFMRDSLDKFFKAGIIPTYSQKTTTAAMKQSAKELGIDLKQIIKENDGDKAKAMVQITDRVVKMTGFEKADADLLASEVISAYTKTLNEYTKQRLDQMFLSEPKPKNKKSAFDELMELINMGAYERQDIVDAIKQKNKLPVLTSEDIQTIQENVEKANQYKRYSYEWKMYMARAQQVASDKMPQARKDKITQFKRIMMLSNPRTHTRNIVGNVPLSGTEIISDVIGSMVDKGLSSARGTQRTTTANPFITEFLRGFGSGAVDTVKDIRNNVNTYRMGDESVTQYEMPRGRTFDNSFLNGIDNAISYGLMFGDRTFFEGHYRKRLAQLDKLGYDVTSSEAKAEAYAYAVDMVFQSDSKMAEGARKFREALNSIFTVNGFALGDFVIPFVQTPANIADKLLDYSPVGFAKAMGQAINSKTEAFDQRLFCQRVGRALTGTAILGVSYALASAGVITGGAPDDAEERNALYAAGWKPYSFYIDGKYYDYSFIQPVGMLLAMGADAYRERQNAEDLNDLAAVLFAGAKGGADCFFNMSFFSSLTDFFGGFGSTAENMASAFMDFPGQFAPAILNAANKSVDPYQRETYDSDPIKRTINKFIAKTPASQTLPIKQDVYGRDMMQNQGREVVKRTIENMIFPSTMSERKEDVLNDELLRLHDDTGKSAQFLSYPDKKQNLGDGNEFRLSGEEYVQFTKDANGYAAEQMTKFIESDFYNSLDDDTRISVLNDIEGYATYNAKKKFAETKGVTYSDSEYEKLEASGLEPYEYYSVKQRFGGKWSNYDYASKYGDYADRMQMQDDKFVEVYDYLGDLQSDKDKNGKAISNSRRKKVEAYLDDELSAGNITKEQYWYFLTKEYPSEAKNAPYAWIREANK